MSDVPKMTQKDLDRLEEILYATFAQHYTPAEVADGVLRTGLNLLLSSCPPGTEALNLGVFEQAADKLAEKARSKLDTYAKAKRAALQRRGLH
jgi:hypothetical protein